MLCILFKLPNDLAIGVLLAACSPGGGMSNMTTVVIEGHLLLSIAMTFMSTCLAVGKRTRTDNDGDSDGEWW